MSCQEAFFTDAHCRIEIEPWQTFGGTRYVATVSAVDRDTHALRPIVARDGARLAFPGESEQLAFNSAVAFLTEQFGGFSAITYACGQRESAPTPAGPPLVVENV